LGKRIWIFAVTFGALAGGLWGVSEPASFFAGAGLRTLVGDFWWAIYLVIPAVSGLIAAMTGDRTLQRLEFLSRPLPLWIGLLWPVLIAVVVTRWCSPAALVDREREHGKKQIQSTAAKRGGEPVAQHGKDTNAQTNTTPAPESTPIPAPDKTGLVTIGSRPVGGAVELVGRSKGMLTIPVPKDSVRAGEMVLRACWERYGLLECQVEVEPDKTTSFSVRWETGQVHALVGNDGRDYQCTSRPILKCPVVSHD
jgi:hypothetical protein